MQRTAECAPVSPPVCQETSLAPPHFAVIIPAAITHPLSGRLGEIAESRTRPLRSQDQGNALHEIGGSIGSAACRANGTHGIWQDHLVCAVAG